MWLKNALFDLCVRILCGIISQRGGKNQREGSTPYEGKLLGRYYDLDRLPFTKFSLPSLVWTYLSTEGSLESSQHLPGLPINIDKLSLSSTPSMKCKHQQELRIAFCIQTSPPSNGFCTCSFVHSQ
jgi:hypothetical protein